MKKLLLSLLLVVFVFGVSFSQNHKGKTIQDPIPNVAVVQFLNKTNKIIHECHELVKTNKVYTGGVYTAKEHQLKAISQFNNHKNQKAVNNSYIARRLAFRAYIANTDNAVPQAWKLTDKEKKIVKIQVNKQMLDNLLDEAAKEKEQETDFDVDELTDVDETSKGKR